jgi:histidinol-phosphate aminotransferase
MNNLVRPNIAKLKPYSSARDEFSGSKAIFLDANENPNRSEVNRYPDPVQKSLKRRISGLKKVPQKSIFLGNGSDEAIDLLFRIFCQPGIDNVIIPVPTYGMYQVCADINDVQVRNVLLDQEFDIDIIAIKENIDDYTKMIFLCSPNNPTGNMFSYDRILEILSFFKGIVIIDEAYIDFSTESSWSDKLKKFPNLVILQTFSKAYGMAGIRLGMAFASQLIVNIMNKVKYPYNINNLTSRYAIDKLENNSVNDQVAQIIAEREKLADFLSDFKFISKVYPSDSNFLLIKCDDANHLYNYLITNRIVVRNRTNQPLLKNCLRISIGTPKENQKLIDTLKQY